jgi:cytoplasmic iron level regulating protein YaaA (DUF328/UPF0246 family)
MDYAKATIKGDQLTAPEFREDAARIVEVIKNTKDLSSLMKVSPALVEETRKKYETWGEKTTPAIYSYVGDVYKGFYAKTLTTEDIRWAQKHLRIMSGLYGVLRPLDEISHYRLEMKAPLSVGNKKDLYEFWGSRLAKNADAETNDGIICILSSREYAWPVTRFSKSTIITPVFYDNKPNGIVGTVPIYSKMMRGVMARWVIDHRIEKPDELEKFEAQGYHFDAKRSTKNNPAFFREIPRPITYTK